MKKICVLTIILLFSFSLHSQENLDKYTVFEKNGTVWKTNGKDTIVIADKMPEFKGGKAKLIEYITNNFKYPKSARRDKIEGKVIVDFLITEEGKITDVKIKKGVRQDLDNEAMRLIREMPRWNPGELNGKNIHVSYTLPINFTL